MSELLGYLGGDNRLLFWLTAAALALGATFLATSLFLLLRGGLQGLLLRISRAGVPGRPRTHATVANATVASAAPPRTAPSPPPTAPLAAAAAAAGSDSLLRRLRAAGDRLERLAEEAPACGSPASDSTLKDPATPVEYVFKASRL